MWFIGIGLFWLFMTGISTIWAWFVDKQDSMYLYRPHYTLEHIFITSLGVWYLLIPFATIDYIQDRIRVKRNKQDGKF